MINEDQEYFEMKMGKTCYSRSPHSYPQGGLLLYWTDSLHVMSRDDKAGQR